MKYIVRFFVITFLLFGFKYSYAESHIAYIDMDIVLNGSIAGKMATKKLTQKHKENIEYFKSTEENLRKEEEDLLSKKNIIKKEEYDEKINVLRKKLQLYQKERKIKLDGLTQKRTEARKVILDAVQPILADYIEENQISLVIDKKNIIIGKRDLEITDAIIDELNKKLPSIKLN